MPNLEVIYRAYTRHFTHTDLGTTYKPQSICNRHEVKAIWSHFQNVNECLEAMHKRIGTASARQPCSFEELPS